MTRLKFALTLLCWLACAPAQAAIGFIADGGYASGTSSVVLTKPAGVAAGNLLVAFVTVQDGGGTSTVTTLSGWTFIVNLKGILSGGAYSNEYAFYRVATSADVSATNYTWTGTSGSGFDGDIRAYSGTATSLPIINYSAGAQASGTSITIPTFSGHETFVSGEWYVAGFVDSNNNTLSGSSPALSNTYQNGGSFQSYYVGNYTPVSVPGTQAITGASAGAVGLGLTILPSGGTPPSCPLTRAQMGVGC